MATGEAAASVLERDGATVIALRGQLDRSAEDALEGAYAEAIALDAGSILLDFEQVDYINSTGIALIVSILAKARAAQRPVSACGLSEHYREIFEITRLADFMKIFPDEATALASSNQSNGGG